MPWLQRIEWDNLCYRVDIVFLAVRHGTRIRDAAPPVPHVPERPAEKHLGLSNGHSLADSMTSIDPALAQSSWTGNLCSSCGCNTLVYEEGCKKCHACGYSEC
ncbi:MAG: hypothetical protein KGJ86_21655 [Chloroflexota bacterium]|nr:hypothetical protein [Chloroflexota bacterium]